MKISGIKEFFLLYCGEWEAMEGKGGYGIAGIRRFCYTDAEAEPVSTER